MEEEEDTVEEVSIISCPKTSTSLLSWSSKQKTRESLAIYIPLFLPVPFLTVRLRLQFLFFFWLWRGRLRWRRLWW